MPTKPSDLEMQVLSVLWEHGPLTVRDILNRLPDGKDRAYTTVLTIMQGMTRKELVTRTKEGTAHVFHPAVSRDEVLQPVMSRLLRNVFGGNPTHVVQALFDSTDVTSDDLAEIRKLIDDAAQRDAAQRKEQDQ